MPRKSAAQLAIISPVAPSKLPLCRADAPKPVQRVFAALVGSVPSDHFRPSDAPLLEQYSVAVLMAEEALKNLNEEGAVIDGRPSPWVVVLEKANRASVALAAKLRLCPAARMDSRAATRKQGPAPSAYELGAYE